MTSVLPEEESNVTRLKQITQTHDSRGNSMVKSCVHEESRSFLNFSRENLSISNSDLEQGFNKSTRTRCCSRQTLLSCAALLLALGCAGLELWKLRRVLANASDIESLKRDVDTLKHRFLEMDLLDELKAFEEQLYGEGASEEDDLSSSSGGSNDYDSSYDDSVSASSSGDYPTVTYPPNQPFTSTSSSAVAKSTVSSTAQPVPTPCTSKDLEDVFAVLRRAEAERGQAFEKSVREREGLLEEERERERRRMIGEHRARSGSERTRRQILQRWDFRTRLKHPPKK